MDAILLAGSPNQGLYKSPDEVPYEALIPIGSKLMIQYVIEALLNSRYLEKIVIVGPEQGLKEMYRDNDKIVFTDPGNSIVENIRRAYNILNHITVNYEHPANDLAITGEKLFVITCDLPLITSEAIDDFISRCLEQKADLFYSVVPKFKIDESYPESVRTYVNLKEGIFTGGNIFVVKANAIQNCLERGQELVDLRKKPLALCRVVGLKFLLKFLLRMMSLREAETNVSRLLGIKGKVVISNYPEIGIDVDKPSDLELINKIFSKQKCI